MTTVVFLGPTLPLGEAQRLLDARFLPPVAMGDILRAVDRLRPAAIGIIDGYFDRIPAVWHKEILYALSRGVPVLGAASMGALRAAELWPYGMEGVGWVYQAFRRGELEDDDEVAVAHADAESGYRMLSEAMVNLRVGLARAVERGVITDPSRTRLLERAKGWYYPERSWPRLLEDAAECDVPAAEVESLRVFVGDQRPDIKREDARALLDQLGRARPVPERAPPPAPTRTVFWDRLTACLREGPDAAVLRALRAPAAGTADLQHAALLLHLVVEECEAAGVALTQPMVDQAVRGFRLRRGLVSADALQSWLDQNGISANDFRRLMHLEARVCALLRLYRKPVDQRLFDAAALTGVLPTPRAQRSSQPKSQEDS